MNLDNRMVLLTGATGGIGRAAAQLLTAAGARLLLTARNADRLGQLAIELRAAGGDVRTVAADLATRDGRNTLLAAAQDLPTVDMLVNNAGVGHFGEFAQQSGSSIADMVSTNLLAPMLLVRELLPVLQRAPEAVILNVGSILGSIGLPGQAAYAATKFALHGFSEALRRELEGTGVRVLYLAPRSTDTSMNDAALRAVNSRLGVSTDDPERVARQLVAVLRECRCERFIGWPERVFVKLNALLPSLVDRGTRRQAKLLRHFEQPSILKTLPSGADQ